MNEDNNYNNRDKEPEVVFSDNPKYVYEDEHPKKKKNHWFLKALGFVCAAIVFGGIAGLTMVGITKVAGIDDALNKIVASVDKDATTTQKAISKNEDKIDIEATPIEKTHPHETEFNDVSDIVSECMPTVVAITGTSEVTYSSWFGPDQTFEAESSGSGIIIGEKDEEYLIVTNNHVVENTKSLSIKFVDDEIAEATIKGTDPEVDIAIIAVKKADVKNSTKKAIRIATIGDSDKLKVGQGVIAIGNALGYGQSVTVGYISALNREVQVDQFTTKNLIQTDAAINPGNSGGALLNMNGELVGINSAKYSSTEIEGMGYAIPISTVLNIINNLSNRQTREQVAEEEQGYLGIQGQSIDETTAAMYDMPQGVYVYKVLEGGGAEKSALKEKDIITKIDGQRIQSMEQLKDQLTYYKAGEEIPVTIQRLEDSKYVEKEIKIKLGSKDTIKVEE